MNTRATRGTAFAITAGAVLAFTALGTPSARAVDRNGLCEAGEFCLYPGANQTGSASDFVASVPDYGSSAATCYTFRGAGTGKGSCVKNRAASVWNNTSAPVTVYYNSQYGGATQVIPAKTKANLNSTLKNNNAAHRIGAAPKKMSTTLYKATGGWLLCAFDGYNKGNCGKFGSWRHEGIDFRRTLGSPVYALAPGVVTRVVEKSGTSGLSTIAVYYAAKNKTVIYLHTDPNNNLRLGANVKIGDLIGTENYRGAGTSGNHHTHVEVRAGNATAAAVSKDSVLVNENPKTFWTSIGYVYPAS